jgi:hypothetical protein
MQLDGKSKVNKFFDKKDHNNILDSIPTIEDGAICGGNMPPSDSEDDLDIHKKSDIFDTSKEKIKSSNNQQQTEDMLPDMGFKGSGADGGEGEEE